MEIRCDLKSQVYTAALKMFAKEIGAPDVIVCDYGGEQKSKSVKKFCYQIGTTLRYLEESTPWSNVSWTSSILTSLLVFSLAFSLLFATVLLEHSNEGILISILQAKAMQCCQ
jgi:hypothetical protein